MFLIAFCNENIFVKLFQTDFRASSTPPFFKIISRLVVFSNEFYRDVIILKFKSWQAVNFNYKNNIDALWKRDKNVVLFSWGISIIHWAIIRKVLMAVRLRSPISTSKVLSSNRGLDRHFFWLNKTLFFRACYHQHSLFRFDKFYFVSKINIS